jgi:L-alanine-DL-glutamate epimerase-like enolase superfamily enzyme
MRITAVKALPITIPRLKELKVAYATRTVYQGVLVLLETDAGLTGLGEAAPNFEVCRETQEGTVAALAAMAPVVRGGDPLEREALLARLEPWRRDHAAALTAVDLALWDLAGKAAGLPVRNLLGGFRRSIPNAMTIGILPLDRTLEEARAILASGAFAEIKLKLGLDAQLDVARVHAVRAAVGPDVPLHVDANQGYDRQAALAVLTALAADHIAFAEQPVAAGDIEALKWVSERSPVKVMADEAVHTPEDALALVRTGACSMLNIKLQKIGGISRALDALAVARTGGLSCLIGCMTETLVGISAGAHLALASPVVDHVDLDGYVDLAFQPVTGGVRVAGDQLTVTDAAGLGVAFTGEWQERFDQADPLR